MSYEQRRDWGRGRGRGGDGGSSAASSGGGGHGGRGGGRGRHPSHLKGREIGLWYARKQGQKSKETDRQQVGRALCPGVGAAARGRGAPRRCRCALTDAFLAEGRGADGRAAGGADRAAAERRAAQGREGAGSHVVVVRGRGGVRMRALASSRRSGGRRAGRISAMCFARTLGS